MNDYLTLFLLHFSQFDNMETTYLDDEVVDFCCSSDDEIQQISLEGGVVYLSLIYPLKSSKIKGVLPIKAVCGHLPTLGLDRAAW